MGDVIHALPVVQDIRKALPDATIDWVVEPGFATLLRRVKGLNDVIEAPVRRWTRTWWRSQTRIEVAAFLCRLRRDRYDAILDLQGLAKSGLVAMMARGHRYALANRTLGSGYEPATRWLANTAIRIESRVHVIDRSRLLAARALHYDISGPPDFGLRIDLPDARTQAIQPTPPGTIAFLHGTSRDDKLWPEAQWISLGRMLIEKGWQIGIPQGSASESARATRMAAALGPRATVWPHMPLDEVMTVLGQCRGAIGVDSGLSHLAVALGLAHVQIYNFDTAWRTGPLVEHGHTHQVALFARPAPTLHAVAAAWSEVDSAKKISA